MQLKIEYHDPHDLTPYEGNAREHREEDLEAIRASIREFGFNDPIGVWSDQNLIVEGHGRQLAAIAEGIKSVPCIRLDHMTDEQRRAYALAHNKTAELSEWDLQRLDFELAGIQEIDMSMFGFDGSYGGDWFDTRERNDQSRQEGNDEYNEFLDKFEPKKTTDDCYTPDVVYDAIAGWVTKEYGVDRSRFVRPFYPGGDYQREAYKSRDVVVDNPPFSILSEILRFYCEKEIQFFLFAPALTLFTGRGLDLCYIPANGDITYENGAVISTSFITNLDKRYMIRTAPELTELIIEANRQNRSEIAKPVNLKYRFPPYVVTAAMVGAWGAAGVDFRVEKKNGVRISELDAQKQFDKAIYGGGFLLSEKAKAEAEKAKAEAEKAKAEAEKAKALEAAKGTIEIDEKTGEIIWQLSEREMEIVRSLGEAG